MTDRVNSLTVVLEKDLRIDDVDPVLNAIQQLKGVISVDVNISSIESHIAETRARHELEQKIYDALKK